MARKTKRQLEIEAKRELLEEQAKQTIEGMAPVADPRRGNGGWEHAKLWDSLTMDERYGVLTEAGVDVNKDWWAACVPEYTTYDQLLYDIAKQIEPILKKRVRQAS